MASPEEMLEHPANDLVRTFMGKHTPDTAPSKVESFMRTNVFSVRKDRGVLECAERMARGSVDTLLVTDEDGHYVGTVSIGDIRHWGRELNSIEPLVRQTARTARVGDEAKESFDYLLDSGASYVVVLNADDTIAGIVTKTSVARSVAENLWGMPNDRDVADPLHDYGAKMGTAICQHTIYVLVSVAIGFAVGLVLGILLSRIPRWLSGVIIPVLSIFQTIPGLVFIGVLFIWWGNIYPTVIVASVCTPCSQC